MVIPTKVSVIIPAYNMASTITAAIESVREQLFNDYELIIVDDGSTDKTRSTIKEYLQGGEKEDRRISYVFQKNQGRGAAINTGVKASRSEYITFLDADDVLTKSSLKLRVEPLEKNQDYAMVYADAFYVDRKGNPYKVRKSRSFKNSQKLLKALLYNPITPIIGPTVMIRRNVFLTMGGYNPIFRRNQDQELHIRIIGKYNALYVPEAVLLYRTYCRRSKILIYKLNGIKSWFGIIDSYIPRRSQRIYLKSKRSFFELMKLVYELFLYRK